MIGYRNMLCGMHVHVEVPDTDTRVNLIMRLTPYLPLLLALSTSSPFWQGQLTGLCGYRLAAYDELPRTGLPELFRTTEDYNEFVAALPGPRSSPTRVTSGGRCDRRCETRRSNCASPTVARGSTMRWRSPRCSAAWCARSTATARSIPVSTASGAPSRWRTSGTRSATASPPLSSIRFRARRSRSSNGSTRCSISSPRTSRRSAAQARSGACTEFSREGTSADRQIDMFAQGQSFRPQKVNGDQGRRSIGRRAKPRRSAANGLKSERRPGFPSPPGPPIKRQVSSASINDREPPESPCRRPSTSSTAPI